MPSLALLRVHVQMPSEPAGSVDLGSVGEGALSSLQSLEHPGNVPPVAHVFLEPWDLTPASAKVHSSGLRVEFASQGRAELFCFSFLPRKCGQQRASSVTHIRGELIHLLISRFMHIPYFGVYRYVSFNSCRDLCVSPHLQLPAWGGGCCVDLGSHLSPPWSPSS